MKKPLSLLLLFLCGCGAWVEELPAPVEAEEPEPVAVTQWTDKTELFVEYPPLRVGSTSRFAIHLTDLETFRPLIEGQAMVALAYGGGQTDTFTEEGPSRPGMFGVDVVPTRAGSAAMTIRVSSEPVTDEHRLGQVRITETDQHEIPEVEDQTSDEGISFLKEQQWTLGGFSTQIVENAGMRESLVVPATIQPRSGGRVAITAPLGGSLSTSVKLPVIGMSVMREQIVAAMVPPTNAPSDLAALDLAVEEARVKLDLSRQELARVERLLDVGAIPARRVNEAKSQEALALAQLKAAEARIEQYEQSRQDEHRDNPRVTFQIRSPLSGVVADVRATDGEHLEEGDGLIEVVAVDVVYVVGEIPESVAASLSRPTGAEVIAPGIEDPIQAGRLISVASLVDPKTRTVKVIYELMNRARRLAVGQTVSLRLFGRLETQGPVIVDSAVVDDAGQTVVYVQTGGESFERRAVTLGERRDGKVLVTGGVSPGERVVIQGGYLIRLASMSTQAPAHGHAH